MDFSNQYVASKLRRWEGYMNNYHLPEWHSIPNIGLYMEQVILILQEYLDYLPPELKEETFLTAATINNYVRKQIMPEPVHKKYYRRHIAYLIMILTLKQSLSLAMIQKVLPLTHTEEQIETIYSEYASQHHKITDYFMDVIRDMSGPILEHEQIADIATAEVSSLITSCAIMSDFFRTLSVKLILLDGQHSESKT